MSIEKDIYQSKFRNEYQRVSKTGCPEGELNGILKNISEDEAAKLGKISDKIRSTA